MATSQKQILYSPVDIDDADFQDFNREPSEDELEFQKFKEEFKQSNEYAKVSVYRQPTTSDGRPGQKNLTFLFEAGVEEYTFSQLAGRLRDEYGTGTYRIQLRDKENLMKMNRAVSIEAPKIKGDETNPQNIIATVSRALQEQQIRTENMFRQIAGPQTGGDAFDQMTKMMTAMGAMMGAIGFQPQPQQVQIPPKTLVEQLTEFKMIKELFGGDDSGDYGGDANLYSLLGETVKAFGGPIAAAIAAGARSGDLDPDGLAIQGRLPAPQPKTDEIVNEENKKMEMRKNIHILIQNAKTGIPPQSFAMILVNNTPEDKADALWDFISAENCVDEIVKLEPAAERYLEWFSALRLEVIDLMSEPDDTDLTDSETGAQTPKPQSVAGVDLASQKESTASDASDSDPTINP